MRGAARGGCQRVLGAAACTRGKKAADGLRKGFLSDRKTGQMWADSQSISDGIFVVVVLTFSAKNSWLMNLLKANF